MKKGKCYVGWCTYNIVEVLKGCEANVLDSSMGIFRMIVLVE